MILETSDYPIMFCEGYLSLSRDAGDSGKQNNNPVAKPNLFPPLAVHCSVLCGHHTVLSHFITCAKLPEETKL